MEKCIKDRLIISDEIKNKIFEFLKQNHAVRLAINNLEMLDFFRVLQITCLWEVYSTDIGQVVSFDKVFQIVNDFCLSVVDDEILR